jgi:hypothetical protein
MQRFAELDGPEQAYAAMTFEADEVVGNVLRKLSELDLEKQTLILMTLANKPTFPPSILRKRPIFKGCGINGIPE